MAPAPKPIKKPVLRPYTYTINSDLFKLPFEKVEMTEAINYEHMNINVIVKEDIKTDGYAELVLEPLQLNCYVPPYVTIVNVNKTSVMDHYNQLGVTQFANYYNYPGIFAIQIEDAKKNTCVWYSPSKSQIEKEGSEQVSNYPYNKAKKIGGCFNPELTGSVKTFGTCGFPPSQGGFNACSASTLATWEDITIAYDGDHPSHKIQRSYFSNRVPHYRIVNEANIHNDPDNAIVMESTQDIALILKTFEELTPNDVVVNTSTNGKVSYFKTVLTV